MTVDLQDRPLLITLLALIFSLWLTAGVSWAGAPHQQTANQCDTAANKNCVTQKPPKEPFWERTTGDPVAFYTFVMAVFTVILAIVAAIQGIFLYSANSHSVKAFSASRRAYVFPESIFHQWERTPTGEVLYAFRPRWVNSGETQTKGMINYITAEFRDDELPANFDFASPSVIAYPHTIGPKAAAPGCRTRAFTETEMQEIVDGEKFLYVWGWTKYNDIFPGTSQHMSRFCVKVEVYGDPAEPEGAPNTFNILFMVHTSGNCSDEECAVQGLA